MHTLLVHSTFSLEDWLLELLNHNWVAVLQDWREAVKKENVTAIITYLDHKIDRQYLLQYPNCSIVITASTWIDHIDFSYCEKNNIHIISAQWVNASSVAEFTICMIINLLRKVPQHIQDSRQQIRQQRLGNDLAWKVVWLIWCWNIAQQVARKLSVFDVWWLIWYDPYADPQMLEKYNITLCTREHVMHHSDIISIQLPSTSETHHLINEEAFLQMKKNPYIVNVWRGDTVSNSALLNAVNNWLIKWAACDVLEWEPSIDHLLATSKNIILTPHIASKTVECKYQLAEYVINEFLTYVKS